METASDCAPAALPRVETAADSTGHRDSLRNTAYFVGLEAESERKTAEAARIWNDGGSRHEVAEGLAVKSLTRADDYLRRAQKAGLITRADGERRHRSFEVRDQGEPLRRARQAKGFSQIALDRSAGVAAGTCSRLEGEAGYRTGREKAERIARLLATDVDELFTMPSSARPVLRTERHRPPTPPRERPDLNYMKGELERLKADAATRGLLTIDGVRDRFRDQAASAKRTRPPQKLKRPGGVKGVRLMPPHEVASYTRSGVDYYISKKKKGLLPVAEWVTLSTGKQMRLFSEATVDEIARSRFRYPNGNVLEWDEPSDRLKKNVIKTWKLVSQKRFGGRQGARRVGRVGGKKRGYSELQAKAVRDLHPTRSYSEISDQTGLSVKQIRNILG